MENDPMPALKEVSDVAKKKAHGGERAGAGRPKSDRRDASIKFDKLLADKSQMIAKAKGVSRAEYLSEMTRAAIDREYAKVMRELESGGS